MSLDGPLMENLPSTKEVRDKLGATLREAELLRRLLRVAEKAELYRDLVRGGGQKKPKGE
jgi:hypothetical protein